jgi:hypothetical protein
MPGNYVATGRGSGNVRRGADMIGGLAGALRRLEEKTGFRLEERGLIGEDVTFRAWCEDLGAKGLSVDGHRFTLSDRPAMAWIYDQIPSTREEAYRYVLVIMKCAQVGFTVMEILAAIYMGLKFGPCTVGMFLPDMNLAGIKSTERFMPMVRSAPAVHERMTQDNADGTGRKMGEGNVNRRRIDQALFIFSWTSGRSTTESIPMDVLSFDEVQEMTKEQIEKTRERLSASSVRFMLLGSTANWPEEDIHHWYLQGTRHRFHTRCPTCDSRRPLDDYFPECIQLDKARDEYRYVCPNGHWIDDTQIGEWVAEDPSKDLGAEPDDVPMRKRRRRIRSIHFPQFLSPTITPDEIFSDYGSATDMKNFYNRKLGKPYLDPSQVPVTMEILQACVAAGITMGVRCKDRAQGCFMGIDQMGNFNVVVIKERMPDGRQAIVHLEEVYDEDPFARCSVLMKVYNVAACVVEINPNYNDAKRFANRHKGRVFICDSFGSMKEGMIAWGDAPRLDASDRRTDEAERDRYTLRMDQYKCMQVSMARFAQKLCLIPDPQGLVQDVVEKGRTVQAAIAPRAFHHFTKTALVAEKDKETNQFRRSVKKVGIDPHFSYANMLCDVAWSRSHGTSTFIIPQEVNQVEIDRKKAEDMNLHGLPGAVTSMMATRPQGDVCGNCTSFNPDNGMCIERSIIVQPRDPGCPVFIMTEES